MHIENLLHQIQTDELRRDKFRQSADEGRGMEHILEVFVHASDSTSGFWIAQSRTVLSVFWD